jgi:hypothetical protein
MNSESLDSSLLPVEYLEFFDILVGPSLLHF